MMEQAEFHNGLRLLLNIDQDEFTHAIWPDHDGHRPGPDTNKHREWHAFCANPHL